MNYEALNLSSRSFTLGDKVLLPKIPQTITEGDKLVLEQHHWGEFFKLTPVDDGSASAPPVNVDVPLVMPSSVAVGGTLSCTMGNWHGEPTSYEYDWHSATEQLVSSGADYVTTANDVDKSIHCIVTATNAMGSTIAPQSNSATVTAS